MAFDGPGVLLEEASTRDFQLDGEEVAYRAGRFAPIRKTSIEIFQAMDRDVFKGQTVDA